MFAPVVADVFLGIGGAQKHGITSKAEMQWAKKFGVENAADKARIVEVRCMLPAAILLFRTCKAMSPKLG
jgi:hypothetical protein